MGTDAVLTVMADRMKERERERERETERKRERERKRETKRERTEKRKREREREVMCSVNDRCHRYGQTCSAESNKLSNEIEMQWNE